MHFCIFTGAGYIEIVKFMIEKGAKDWNCGLEDSCRNGQMEMVKFMIECAEKNDKNMDWNYGLYYACEGGYLEIVKLMIEKGADDLDYGIGQACKGGLSPSDSTKPRLEIMKYIITYANNKKVKIDWNYVFRCVNHSSNFKMMKIIIKYANVHEIKKILQKNLSEKFVQSFSFSELSKFVKLQCVEQYILKIMKYRLYVLHCCCFGENLFPVLKRFQKKG